MSLRIEHRVHTFRHVRPSKRSEHIYNETDMDSK